MYFSSLGLPQMKISSSCSKLLGKLNSLKSFLMALDPRDVVLSSLLRFKRRRRLFVSDRCVSLLACTLTQLRSKIPAVHVWWTSSRRAVQ
jgi:hypothetical protein